MIFDLNPLLKIGSRAPEFCKQLSTGFLVRSSKLMCSRKRICETVKSHCRPICGTIQCPVKWSPNAAI